MGMHRMVWHEVRIKSSKITSGMVSTGASMPPQLSWSIASAFLSTSPESAGLSFGPDIRTLTNEESSDFLTGCQGLVR